MIFGTLGALGQIGSKALDFEGRRWVRLFEGEYADAKALMSRLDAAAVRHRLSLPRGLPPYHVVVEVMKRSLPQARDAIAQR